MDKAKNFAKAGVGNGYDSFATEIDVLTALGTRFPEPPFNAVWWNASDFPDPADDPNVEIVRVTAIDEDTLTITRGQEGTDAGDHNSEGKAYFLVAGLTAKVVNEDLVRFSTAQTGDRLVITDPSGDLAINDALSLDPDTNTLDLLSTDFVSGLYLDNSGSQAVLGDRLGAGVGVKLTIDNFNGNIILTGLPNSDPAIEGALFYDAGTGVVKRSAG